MQQSEQPLKVWEVGMPMKIRLHLDASAALGIAQRQGVGKVRHLSTHVLWLQEQQVRQFITLMKVHGLKNPGDLLTKCLSRELMGRHLDHGQPMCHDSFGSHHSLPRRSLD